MSNAFTFSFGVFSIKFLLLFDTFQLIVFGVCVSVFNGRLGDCFGGTESQFLKRKKKIDVWA